MNPDSVSYERGRFYLGPNGFPRFAGSASGIYLADTVRSHVSPEVPRSPGIEEAFLARNNDKSRGHDENLLYEHFTLRANDLREAQAPAIRDAVTRYFTTWHPLFPFLDGAFIIDSLDQAIDRARESPPEASAFPDLKVEEGMVLTAIFMAILAIADSEEGDAGDGTRANLPKLNSTSQASLVSHLVVGTCQNSAVNDLLVIQALLAIMLYFYTSRSLRPAMHLSGIVTKLAYEAGLHRCPYRYLQTFVQASDREIRKRVFWSLYVLDRLLTAEFGIPIMLHDTDIDTCIPGGKEAHPNQNTPSDHPARTPIDTTLVTPDGTPQVTTVESDGSTRPRKRLRKNSTCDPTESPSVTSAAQAEPQLQPTAGSSGKDNSPKAIPPDSRLLPARSLIGISKLVGRAMEVFNKSVNYRSLNSRETLQLRTELERWWNDIAFDSDEDFQETAGESAIPTEYKTLFTCLYHHQIINLCRPALSLAPSQLQHAYALQTCVASARIICSTLAREVDKQTLGLLWPGYVDMVFFSSLILVYGNKRDITNGTANPQRLKSELRRAARILEWLQRRWSNLGPFIKALETLLDPNSNVARAETSQASTSAPPEVNARQELPSSDQPLLFDQFLFDFDTFELNPESIWAYHMSLPGSPTGLG